MPMLMLKKPNLADNTLRLRTVIDCRERNANTRKLASPLPDIDAILRNVAAHPYRTLLDGKDAYEQIRVITEHVPRTLFNTPDGTMASLVMQLGDCNGGATYQSLMNHLFAAYIGVFMEVYLDDIIIYSDTAEEHMKHVKLVIDILREQKFYLSEHKLHFFVQKLKLLGHIIDENGIGMDAEKVDKIANWKVPANKAQLLAFNGSVGFLAGDCAGIRIPMGVLAKRTGSTVPWRWTATEQRAFDEVRETVQKWRDNRRVTLDYSPGADPINLVTDGCYTGSSGVVSQGKDFDTAKIVAFWSGKFNTAQQNYPVHEQELLAIVESLKRFKNLLHGARFRIFTDHRSLEYIMTQKNLSPRQSRWLEVLSGFDFEVIYIPGETNLLVDALSRMYSAEPAGTVRSPTEYVSTEEGEDTLPLFNLGLASAPLTTGDSVRASAVAIRTRPQKAVAMHDVPEIDILKDKPVSRIKRVILHVRDPGPSRSGNEAVDEPREIVRETVNLDKAVQEDENAEVVQAQTPEEEVETVVAPKLMEIIAEAQPGMDVPASLKDRYGEDKFFREVLTAPGNYKNFELVDGLIFLRESERRILCIPDVLIGGRSAREIIISHAHSILAHLGGKKTLFYLRDNVWWKDMIKDIRDYCESCSLCQTSKPGNQKLYGLLNPLVPPTRPWETIGVDFVGPLPESKTVSGSFDMLMVVIDHLTSMVHLIPTRQTYRAKDVAEVMFDKVYKYHGLPESIVSDRDSLFTSVFWDRLHKLVGTELKMSTSFHPETDGATERANRTVTQMLRQCISPNQRDWAVKLPGIEFAINSARTETTGYAPFFLNSGQMPRSMVWNSDSEYPGVRVFAQRMKDAVMAAHDAIIAARVKQTRHANKHRKPAPFEKGDLAYLSTKNLTLPKGRARKLVPKFIGPYKILRDYGNNSYQLDLPAELKQRGLHDGFHTSRLRIHKASDDRRFPGRQIEQIRGFGKTSEWVVDKIISHSGKGKTALFNVVWKTGDHTWMPYHEVAHLTTLAGYLEAVGVDSISKLPNKRDIVPDDPQITVGYLGFPAAVSEKERNETRRLAEARRIQEHYLERVAQRRVYRRRRYGGREDSSSSSSSPSERAPEQSTSHHHQVPAMNNPVVTAFQLNTFLDFAQKINSQTITPFDRIPAGYNEYAIMHQHDNQAVPFAPGVVLIDHVQGGVTWKCIAPPGIRVPVPNIPAHAAVEPDAVRDRIMEMGMDSLATMLAKAKANAEGSESQASGVNAFVDLLLADVAGMADAKERLLGRRPEETRPVDFRPPAYDWRRHHHNPYPARGRGGARWRGFNRGRGRGRGGFGNQVLQVAVDGVAQALPVLAAPVPVLAAPVPVVVAQPPQAVEAQIGEGVAGPGPRTLDKGKARAVENHDDDDEGVPKDGLEKDHDMDSGSWYFFAFLILCVWVFIDLLACLEEQTLDNFDVSA